MTEIIKEVYIHCVQDIRNCKNPLDKESKMCYNKATKEEPRSEEILAGRKERQRSVKVGSEEGDEEYEKSQHLIRVARQTVGYPKMTCPHPNTPVAIPERRHER